MNILDWLRDHRRRIESLEGRIQTLEAELHPTFLATPLTSTSWDGDAYSTTAPTTIDLSAVFGVPAGIKAVLVMLIARDSGSSGAGSYDVDLGPSANSNSALRVYVNGITNDVPMAGSGVVPCDANGDIAYKITASGAGTMDVWIQIWGYWL